MDTSSLFRIICIVCIIILAYIAYKILPQYEVTIEESEITDLYKFSTDFRFEPTPSEIDINGEYECTTLDLRECNVNDQTSCGGCKSLNASCKHFDSDMPFIDDDGNEHIIPKNTDSNTGYCMNLTTIAEGCSPQGDYAIMQTGVDTYDYYLMCVCKNPGLIGNMTIDGNCTTIYMCNGKIDDINKPINEIKCICDEYQVADVRNDISYCRNKKLQELSSDELAVLNNENYRDSYLPLDYFDKTIVQNLKEGMELPDPCTRCAVTGKVVFAKATKDKHGNVYCIENSNLPNLVKQVVITDSNSVNGRILNGTIGGDIALAMKWTTVFCVTGQDSILRCYYVCELKNNPGYEILFGDKSTIYIDAPKKGLLNVHYLAKFIRGYNCGPYYETYTTNWKIRMQTQGNRRDIEIITVVPNNFEIYKRKDCPYVTGCSSWDQFEWHTYQKINYEVEFQPLNVVGSTLIPPLYWMNYSSLPFGGLFHINHDGLIDLVYTPTREQAEWLRQRNITSDSDFTLTADDIATW